MLSVASLFVGCGGLDLGFKDAGFNLVWANDIDKDSCETYKKFIHTEIYHGDINKYISTIPKADILIGGPPCQSFSLVGKRIEDDPRSALPLSFAEAVKAIMPKAFLMENVPGLASSKVNGRRLPLILSELFSDLGYKTYLIKIKSVDYFVPQKRERLILFGFVKESIKNDFQMISPKRFSKIIFGKELASKFISSYEALEDLGTPLGNLTRRNEYLDINYSKPPFSEFSILMREKNETGLNLHFIPTMSDRDKEFVKHISPGGNYMDIPDHIATTRILKFKETGGRTTTYGRLDPKKPSYTVNTYFNRPNVGSNYHYFEDRLITPREALRLQSFPDYFTPIFSSQRSLFRQIGNAVPPLMARAIAESIKEVLYG